MKTKKQSKLVLNDLKIDSFVTSLDAKNINTVKGGKIDDSIIRSIVKGTTVIISWL
jgi:hypothetical protein